MITSKGWFATLSGAVLLTSSATLSALEYKLTPKAVPPGERASLEVRLPIPEALRHSDAEPPLIQDDLLTQTRAFMILERDFRREGDEWVWHYEITAYKPGEITVPPAEIRLGSENFSTEATKLTIEGTRTEKDLELREDFDRLSHPIPWGKVALVLTAIAGLVGVAKLVEKYYRRFFPKKTATPAPALAKPTESDLAWLRRQLALVRARLEANGEAAQAVDSLTLILREYFARTTRLPVEAWTTTEFHRRFHENGAALKLLPCFEACDRFKFAADIEHGPAIARATLEESERTLISA